MRLKKLPSYFATSGHTHSIYVLTADHGGTTPSGHHAAESGESATHIHATLYEALGVVATHTGDATDAHDASAISILDTAADFTATDVEGALAELQSDNEAHVAAADPHTGYRLESADHTHASTGAQAGQITDAALSAAVTVAKGGTGATTLADGGVLIGNGTAAVEVLAIPANEGDATHADRFLRGDASAATSPSWKAIEQTCGITIETPAAGDKLIIKFFEEAATIWKVHTTRIAGTSVTWNMYINASFATETTKVFSSDITTSTENTVTSSAPTSTSAIGASTFLIIEIISISGVPTQFHATIRYTTT